MVMPARVGSGDRPSGNRPRPGHTLAEVLVALTFLGASLTAMASAAVLASRWTGDAVGRQQALAVAEAVLDSLTGLPDAPQPGARDVERWTLEWAVDSVGPAKARMIRLTAWTAERGPHSVQLSGVWVAPALALP
jgi:Tfp pilus assembly protein PilV